VHEYIFSAAIWYDEAIALLVAKPFYCSCWH
jgi:hypothetical protein